MNPIEIVMSVVTLLILLIQWMMPSLVDPHVPFGVQVPPERREDPTVKSTARHYRVGMILSFSVTAILWALGAFVCPNVSVVSHLFSFLPFVPLVLGFLAYYRARQALLRAKRNGNWMAGHRQVVIADTNSKRYRANVSWGWSVPTAVLVGATFVIGCLNYARIPRVYPSHYDDSGHVNGWVVKSIGSVFGLGFTQLGLLVLAILIHVTVRRVRMTRDPSRPEESAKAQAARHARLLRATWILFSLVNLGMVWINLATWGIVPTNPQWMVYGTLIPVVAGVLIIALAATGRSNLGLQSPVPSGDTALPVRRDDDRYWILGVLYVNKNDARWMVEKRFGIGWTFNLAHPTSWILTVIIVVIPIVISIVSK